jgi:hypothetical protein
MNLLDLDPCPHFHATKTSECLRESTDILLPMAVPAMAGV